MGLVFEAAHTIVGLSEKIRCFVADHAGRPPDSTPRGAVRNAKSSGGRDLAEKPLSR